jgi:hypothetical protein
VGRRVIYYWESEELLGNSKVQPKCSGRGMEKSKELGTGGSFL